MGYKFLVIDTYYENFLKSFYKRNPEVIDFDYNNLVKALMAQCFGTGDYYSTNLAALGHSAEDLVANDETLQGKWAKENQVDVGNSSVMHKYVRKVPYLRRFVKAEQWLYRVLESQIKLKKPDILYFQNLSLCEPDFIAKVRKDVKLIVGQIACPLPEEKYLHSCDLILTSFPHYVARFRELGIASEYFKIGFEATLVNKLTKLPISYDTVFIGSISKDHGKGTALLEKIASDVEMDFWGYGVESLAPDSHIRKRFHSEAWGLDMYNILYNSKIVVNRHINVAENYANNMRLYETTGVGTFLITDYKDNLNELFEVGKEIEAYKSIDECIEKIKYYLAHDREREKIARAGQERTLREHTYEHRMRELEKIIEAYL